MRLRGCSVCGGVFVFSSTPMGVRKITSPPAVSKEKDTEEKWRWVCVRVSQLSAWRLALKDTGSAGTPDRF